MQKRFERIAEALQRLEPIVVSTVLSPRATEQYAAGAIGHTELEPYAVHLRRLSEDYVSERKYALPPLGSDAAAAAYALYFLPINFAKILFLLHELPQSFAAKSLSILDFGCGPGTGALAAREFFGIETDVALSDHSVAMLSVAGRLLRNSSPDAPAPHVVSPQAALEEGPQYDLVLASNVLTELLEERRVELARKLLSRVLPGGALLILEPALREPTVAAMKLRDTLLAEFSDLVPLFPCTRRDGCPMLREDSDNWCHGTLRWQGSKLVDQLDQLTGFNKHRLKYTGFIFQRGGELKSGVRVLREAQRKKFGLQVMLCGPAVYGDVVVKKRAPEELRKVISRADQFELVDVDVASLERA